MKQHRPKRYKLRAEVYLNQADSKPEAIKEFAKLIKTLDSIRGIRRPYRKPEKLINYLNLWAKGDSNPHEIALTAPSRLRVYQFHHLPRGALLFSIRRFLDKFDYFLFFLSFLSSRAFS